MIRLIPALLIPALAFLTSSCGCKSDVEVPALRPMPNFSSMTARAMQPQKSIDEMMDDIQDELMGEAGTTELVEPPKVVPTK